MKRTFSAVTVVAMSMAISAAAAVAGQDTIPQLERRGMGDVKSVTLSGCVARGTEADSYTLAETKDAAAPASEATPRPPVALSGTDVDMSKHVGHSVAVTGSYAIPTAAPVPGATDKPATVPATAPDDEKKAPRAFTVKSLKMIASSC